MDNYSSLAFSNYDSINAPASVNLTASEDELSRIDIDVQSRTPVSDTYELATESLERAWGYTSETAGDVWKGTKSAFSSVTNYATNALTKIIMILVLILVGYFIFRKELDKL